MKEDDVDIWGDGSTFKGNDIERFYRYGLLVNPALKIYKPWLDQAFIDELGGRAEMSAFMTQGGLRLQDVGREGLLDRLQHARRDARGQGPRAAEQRHQDRRSRSWASRSGATRSPSSAKTVTVRFDEGRPVALNGVDATRPGRAAARSQPHRRPPRPGHERPDREPHHRGQEPRHLRGARAWRCCSSPTSASSPASTTRTRSSSTATTAAASAACSTRAAGSTRRRSCCARPPQRWVARAITGEVTLELRRGNDYSILNTESPNLTYKPERLTMEKGESSFSPQDRIGQLTMRNLDIADTRDKLADLCEGRAARRRAGLVAAAAEGRGRGEVARPSERADSRAETSPARRFHSTASVCLWRRSQSSMLGRLAPVATRSLGRPPASMMRKSK